MASSPAVLIVESDTLLRHPLAEYLRECGFKVYEAATGAEARVMLQARQTAIDIVLADLMTEGSGFELRHWIISQNSGIDVILAGSIEKAVDEAGILCKDGPALAKPYQHHLVLDEIRRALARRERDKKATL